MGGYSGPFCKACEVGTFKLFYSHGVCKPCENKPKNAHYYRKAIDTSECPYACDWGIESVDVNPYCDNTLEVQVLRVGGTLNSLIFMAVSFLVLFVIWISLIMQSNRAKIQI